MDGEALFCLTEHALESLVTRVGPRMKLLKAISSIKYGVSQQSQNWNALPSPVPSSLSVSSFDLNEEPSDCGKGVSASVLPLR